MRVRTKFPLLAAGCVLVAVALVSQPALGELGDDEPARSEVGTTQRPVLLTTEAEIERAKKRRDDSSSPFYASWKSVEKQANVALDYKFSPQEKEHGGRFYEEANLDARRLHALAVAYRVSGDSAYLDKANEALVSWAGFSNEDLPPGDSSPSWRDFRYPGKGTPHAAGLHISRTLVVFADSYAMLEPYLSAGDQEEIERWFGSMRSPIQHSTQLWQSADWFINSNMERQSADPPWLGSQNYNNHLTAHVLGQLAIGYVTDDANLVAYALQDSSNPRDLREVFGGVLVMPGDALQESDKSRNGDDDRWPDPLRSETYDRYRVKATNDDGNDKGLIYSALGQRFVALSAELAKNNGESIDYWQHVPDSGESLRDAYATYAPFQSAPTEAFACRGRYYENSARSDQSRSNWRAMTEMAFREYPYDPDIRAVVRSVDERNYNDRETFGATAPLLDGELLDPPGGPSWTYRSVGDSSVTEPFHTPGGADQHFLGDWDGDGIDTPGWRVGKNYYLSNSPTGSDQPEPLSIGKPCDEAIVGDWDGDGRDSIGLRRGKAFHLFNDYQNGVDISYTAGRASDRVLAGDWDGDGVDSPGFVRGKVFHLRANNQPASGYMDAFAFARTGDRFVAGDWDGDGTDTLAAVRENGNRLEWHLKAENAAGPVETTVTHGGILDAATAGNVDDGNKDELATVAYR